QVMNNPDWEESPIIADRLTWEVAKFADPDAIIVHEAGSVALHSFDFDPIGGGGVFFFFSAPLPPRGGAAGGGGNSRPPPAGVFFCGGGAFFFCPPRASDTGRRPAPPGRPLLQ